MKTLIISYLPRGDRSNTRKILEEFRKGVKGTIEEIEVSKEVPDVLDADRLMAYVLKYYAGQKITPSQQKLLDKMEKMCAQLSSADFVVLAAPMYNFSVPAPMKAWIDSVVLAGKTFKMSDKEYEGLLNSKGLVICTSGGAYAGEWGKHDHATTLMKEVLEFMGIKTEIAFAQGMNMNQEKETLPAAIDKVKKVAQSWYGDIKHDENTSPQIREPGKIRSRLAPEQV